MNEIFQKIKNCAELSFEDAVKLLNLPVFSPEYYQILQLANQFARNSFQQKGLIFSQIGLDVAPCPVNCKFCTLAEDRFDKTERKQLELKEILGKVDDLLSAGTNEVFLMTTATYDKDLLLEVATEVRKHLPSTMRMVANTGDFDEEYGIKLRSAGFTGIYHICRLGEGVVTNVSVEQRINTLEAIQKAGLELYYCVEPIGPEHSSEEIAEEVFRALKYNVNVMAVMKRVCFPDSPMTEKGEISSGMLALICAVSVLCVRPQRAMGVHEPDLISLISGANQIYAENGSNPRDLSDKTEYSRGFSVAKAKKLLLDAEWDPA